VPTKSKQKNRHGMHSVPSAEGPEYKFRPFPNLPELTRGILEKYNLSTKLVRRAFACLRELDAEVESDQELFEVLAQLDREEVP
jgi:hypothetical protein